MRLIYDQVQLRLPAAVSFRGSGDEALGVAVALESQLQLRAVAGASDVQVSDNLGQRLGAAGVQVLLRAAQRVFDYLGVAHAGCQVSGQLAWPVAHGASYDSLLAVAGTLLAVGLAAEDTLSQSELVELAVQSGGVAELVVPMITGGAALVWTKDKGRGVRSVFLPVPAEFLEGVLLFPKTPTRTQLQQLTYALDNFGLLTAIFSGVAAHPTTEVLQLASLGKVSDPHAGNRVVGQLVTYLRELGFPAAITGTAEGVAVFGQLPAEVVSQAQAAGWQVMSVSFLPEGAKVESSLAS